MDLWKKICFQFSAHLHVLEGLEDDLAISIKSSSESVYDSAFFYGDTNLVDALSQEQMHGIY